MSLLLAAVATAFGATPARAEIYTVAGHSIRFQVPPGYCLVDRQGVVGNAAFNTLEKLAGEDIQLVAVYLDCDELTALVATHRSPILHMGLLSLPKSGGDIIIRPDSTRRDEIDRAVQRINTIDVQTLNTILRVHGRDLGFTMPELKQQRLIARDDLAAYAALMLSSDDQSMSMIALMAISKTNALPFSNIMVAPAADPNVLDTLLSAQRRYLASLIDQNETAEQKRQQSQATPGMSDSLVGTLAGSGSIAIGALCLLGAVWLLIRMRRS